MPAIILPPLLVLLGPLDLITGLAQGHYPTEATLISGVSFIVGLVLVRHNLIKHSTESANLTKAPHGSYEYNEDYEAAENQALAVATAHLNTRLGTGLLIFGILLNLLFMFNGLLGSQKVTDSAAGNIVEIGFTIFFSLMVAGLEVLGARIYTAGSH